MLISSELWLGINETEAILVDLFLDHIVFAMFADCLSRFALADYHHKRKRTSKQRADRTDGSRRREVHFYTVVRCNTFHLGAGLLRTTEKLASALRRKMHLRIICTGQLSSARRLTPSHVFTSECSLSISLRNSLNEDKFKDKIDANDRAKIEAVVKETQVTGNHTRTTSFVTV